MIVQIKAIMTRVKFSSICFDGGLQVRVLQGRIGVVGGLLDGVLEARKVQVLQVPVLQVLMLQVKSIPVQSSPVYMPLQGMLRNQDWDI